MAGLGEVLSITAAATWALGVILYRKLGADLPPLLLNLLKNALVLALMVPTVLLTHGLGWPALSPAALGVVLLSGALGIALADTLYFRALNDLGAGPTSCSSASA
ncbi:MAG: EamA family transporter [Xanthomonadales bacterium]|nr:EamA family transporter [Xanthomonadales bacterium]